LKSRAVFVIALSVFSVVSACAQKAVTDQPAKPEDQSPHTVQFVSVDKGLKLEVLDWGRTGRPVLLLAGLGYDAHVFDVFALKLSSSYHVYGISRRGYGGSSAPRPDGENYSADRLGDDILAVMDALKIERPVLVGHSIAGEELSSIGSRYPDKVAGLVYLDAGYAYAYYNDNAKQGQDPVTDITKVQVELDKFKNYLPPKEQRIEAEHLLNVSLPRLERDIREGLKQAQNTPDNPPAPPDTPPVRAGIAIRRGTQIYTGVKCPVLAIFALPHDFGPLGNTDPAVRAEMVSKDVALVSEQADAFQAGNPQARVVRIANANHFVFRSNEADVLREMNGFIAKLPQ
jgi:non-heme chloroperoxidase